MRYRTAATVSASLFWTLACGGGAGPTGTSPPPPPPAPPPPGPSQTITGFVYHRSDTEAWPAPPSMGSPLAGARVTIGQHETTTGVDGAFTVQTSLTPSADLVPLTASLPGMQPTTYPWRHAESGTAVALGLYPEVVANPRPGFLKGVVLMDGGGWLPLWYQNGWALTTIDRAQQSTGANLVSYVDNYFVYGIDTVANRVDIRPDPWGMGTRAQYEAMVARARARGLGFMLLFGLYPTAEATPSYQALWGIPPERTAFWDAYFAAYQSQVVDRARLAHDLGIEYLGVGYSLGYLTRLEVARWQGLVTAVRATGYQGKLVYFAYVSTAQAFNPVEVIPAGFFPLFDAMGLYLTEGVWRRDATVLGRAYSRARMREDLTQIFDRTRSRLGTAPVPLLVMLGTPSVHGGVSVAEYIEPAIAGNPIALSRIRDYQQQADLYQAAAEAINATPTGSGRVMGLLTWGYTWSDDLTRGAGPGQAAFDKSANVRGKPAEAVLTWWFQRW